MGENGIANGVAQVRRGGKLYDERGFAKRKMALLSDFAFSFRNLLLSHRPARFLAVMDFVLRI